ncbi:COG2958 family protein [Microbulbifer guangxiensis]|uniref:COG2958 family protein n=1 Tax=Microbulbifer guangxiensis TaxID=2904249 RepID=UPI001F4381FA|nr:hypothetical protein [Microbulbifer guangxiensis]
MAKSSQSKKVVSILREFPRQKLTAREIAFKLYEKYREDYQKKRNNPRFSDDEEFIKQLVAEIGSQKTQILGADKHVCWQDKPRPRVYWYDPDFDVGAKVKVSEGNGADERGFQFTDDNPYTEQRLYPVLVDYLNSELGLYCQRIDEKRSRNSRGAGGNQWLHPDIVAMQPVDKEWDEIVRSCVKQGAGQSVRLWSFEVKKELSGSNARKSFFQAVSNSSWANEGYLVATSISGQGVEQELRMLSALHGIGIILLNPENPSESDMILPARPRDEIDWQSVNRILIENEDFKEYIDLVSTYLQTGRIRPKDWNRI